MLDREEYVEQAHLFRTLSERLGENLPIQELLAALKQEVLSTTRLPLALDFLLAEIKHAGTMSSAMGRLAHYFTPFQTYVMREAEAERGRFDMRIGIDILRHEAQYRSQAPIPQGLFMYQFECLCRNRLKYDPGLAAIADDPLYDDDWRTWIRDLRLRIGMVDFADMIYVRSQFNIIHLTKPGQPPPVPEKPLLFGEKEGKIAWANRRKDPLYLFSALQRHLGYPPVPRPKRPDESANLVPLLQVRVERLEARLKLLEDEQKDKGIDITKFYGPTSVPLPHVLPPDDVV
ncbi:MAG: hypothetical protein SFU86_22770 [Pirellulaceae bacterium]|nr:hypothetical protein [Pirellulaceae bacterium]